MAETRLWRDVPVNERMLADDIRDCNGADEPKWLQRQLAWLERPDDGPGCQRAVRWRPGSDQPWMRCRAATAPGEAFCRHHGGPPVPRTERPRRWTADEFRLRRRQIKRDALVRRREHLVGEIAAIDRHMQILEEEMAQPPAAEP